MSRAISTISASCAANSFHAARPKRPTKSSCAACHSGNAFSTRRMPFAVSATCLARGAAFVTTTSPSRAERLEGAVERRALEHQLFGDLRQQYWSVAPPNRSQQRKLGRRQAGVGQPSVVDADEGTSRAPQVPAAHLDAAARS